MKSLTRLQAVRARSVETRPPASSTPDAVARRRMLYLGAFSAAFDGGGRGANTSSRAASGPAVAAGSGLTSGGAMK
jgi:hypothetical protein